MAWKPLTCAGLLVIVAASPVAADWNSFWHGVDVDYQRNNAWPHPFSELAAAQTRMPFVVQKMNGWRLHNTISHELFRDGDGVLTAAGQQQLQQIATQNPPEHRVVYVVRGATPNETEARVASIRSSLARMNLQTAPPDVLVTDRVPATGSGAMAAAVNRARMQTLPPPQLPRNEGPSVRGE